MALEPLSVLVLYRHALMGQGLERMLAGEDGLRVAAVDVSTARALEAALAADPDVIVLEQGGPVDAAELVRRSSCRLLLAVDITSARAFTLRREPVPSCPEALVAVVRDARTSRDGTAPDAPEAVDPDGDLHPIAVAISTPSARR